jgi:hypothetical protein
MTPLSMRAPFYPRARSKSTNVQVSCSWFANPGVCGPNPVQLSTTTPAFDDRRRPVRCGRTFRAVGGDLEAPNAISFGVAERAGGNRAFLILGEAVCRELSGVTERGISGQWPVAARSAPGHPHWRIIHARSHGRPSNGSGPRARDHLVLPMVADHPNAPPPCWPSSAGLSRQAATSGRLRPDS